MRDDDEYEDSPAMKLAKTMATSPYAKMAVENSIAALPLIRPFLPVRRLKAAQPLQEPEVEPPSIHDTRLTVSAPADAATAPKPPQAGAAPVASPPKKANKKHHRGAISAPALAGLLIGVGVRQIRNWDAYTNRPSDYPGRDDVMLIQGFVAKWNARKRMEQAGRAALRASSGGGISDHADKDAFDET